MTGKIWNRYIELQVGSLFVTNQNLKIDFSIKAGDSSDANTFEISIWNLKRANREAIKADQDIFLTAGYEDDYGSIFTGTVKTVGDERDGSDIKTRIIALTQEYAKKVTVPTYRKGTAIGTIVREMFSLSKLTIGKIDDQGVVLDSDATPSGTTVYEVLDWCKNTINGSQDVLNEIKKEVRFYIEGGEAFFVPTDYVRPVIEKIVLSSDTGLIETTLENPDDGSYTRAIKCFLQWRVRTNSLIELKSKMTGASGTYNVVEYEHSCDGTEFVTEMKVKPTS